MISTKITYSSLISKGRRKEGRKEEEKGGGDDEKRKEKGQDRQEKYFFPHLQKEETLRFQQIM